MPVIFVCENNGYAEFTPLSAHTLVSRLANHAQTYSIPNVTVDGNEILAVREAIHEAVRTARAGEGPSFLECLTYRLRGHYEGDPGKYRELAELAEWKEKDPIARLARVLKKEHSIPDGPLKQAESEARELVDRASQFALSSPWPAAGEVDSLVYA